MPQPDTQIDWPTLMAAARAVAANAYAPYSHFSVGAAGIAEDGRLVTGCNVENASYGLTLCAECGLISALHATGGGRLIALSCVDASGELIMPCGRCRQLLFEHSVSGMLVATPVGPVPLTDLLPMAFGRQDS